MKLKKVIAGLFILGLSGVSASQLFAAALSNENIKTNVVYTVSDTTETTDAEKDLEIFYTAKCFEVLKDYFNITPDKLPKDTNFHIVLMSKETLDKEEARLLQMCKEEYEKNNITAEEYAKKAESLRKEYNNLRASIAKLNHDVVSCSFYNGNETNGYYTIQFNANTKEVYNAGVPVSDKGWEIQTAVVDGKAKFQTSSAQDEKNKTLGLSYIKKHQLGGIQNPKFVKLAGTTHNRFLFQDAADPAKQVILFFDPQTHQIFYFNTGKNLYFM